MFNTPQFPKEGGHSVPLFDPKKPTSGLALPSALHAPGVVVQSSTSINIPDHDHRSQDEIRELQNEINLRILQAKALNEKSHIPFWMRNYQFVSYLSYLMIALFSLYYLGQIAIFQADPKMQIPYEDIIHYLEYNSYSILSPLMCPILMGVLAYHVWNRVNLDEGDFFGILGALLLLALVSIHDAYGVYKLSIEMKDRNVQTNEWDPPPADSKSRNEFHWQYAWSTSRSCMKTYVRGLIYQHEYDQSYIQREVLVVEGDPQERDLPGYLADADCILYHIKPEKAQLKDWMKNLQNRYRCCGPYGELEWEPRFKNPSTAGCNMWEDNDGEEIKDCYEPLMRWLQDICVTTYWIMIVQALLYVVSSVSAVVHHTAMKLAARVIVKQYSLLDMTDTGPKEDPWWRQTRPADKPMIVGTYNANTDTNAPEGDGAKGKSVPSEMKTIMMRGGNKSRHPKTMSGVVKKLVAINSNITVGARTLSMKSK